MTRHSAARVLTVALAAVLVLAACDNGDDDVDIGVGEGDGVATTTTEAGDGPAMADGATVGTTESDLGVMLVDSEGRTLYVFLNDEENTSNCTGACLDNWPPLFAESADASGDVDGALLGTTTSNEAGEAQVTYAGRPLYYFAADTGPGDTNGQGVGDVWFVVGVDGEPIRG